jgi:hypothetical protein
MQTLDGVDIVEGMQLWGINLVPDSPVVIDARECWVSANMVFGKHYIKEVCESNHLHVQFPYADKLAALAAVRENQLKLLNRAQMWLRIIDKDIELLQKAKLEHAN